MQELPAPLGCKGESKARIAREILKMNLEIDHEGFIYFNELLYSCMKRAYGNLEETDENLELREFMLN